MDIETAAHAAMLRSLPEMTALDDDDDILSPLEYSGKNLTTRALTTPWWPVSIIAEALRGVGAFDDESVMGFETRPELDEIFGTQEWMQRQLGGDPYDMENLAVDLATPDPWDIARLSHLVPIQIAIRELRNKGEADIADVLDTRRMRAEALDYSNAPPEYIANETGLQVVPMNSDRQLFYRADRSNSHIADSDELRRLTEHGEVTVPLRQIYTNPDLERITSDVMDTPTTLSPQPYSGVETSLYDPSGAVTGGQFDPERSIIEMPVYPAFEGNIDYGKALFAHPELLLQSPEEVLEAARAIDAKRANQTQFSLAHEVEHALQRRYDLPRGSNPMEAEAIARSDINPILDDQGDQFFLGDNQMIATQAHLMKAFDEHGDNPRKFVEALRRSINEIAKEVRDTAPPDATENAIQDVASAMTAVNRRLIDDIQNGYSKLEEEALKALPPSEVSSAVNRAWPRLRNILVERNISRLSSTQDVYRRTWGEAAANTAARYMTEQDPVPVVADRMAAEGKVFSPELLRVRYYEDSYPEITSLDELLEKVREQEKIDYPSLWK